MTSRTSAKRVGPASPLLPTTSGPTQPPSSLLQVSPESPISASCIPLPPGFIIHFTVFSAQTHVDIDIARRRFHENYSRNAVEDSLLTYSQVTKDESTLWAFCIGEDSGGGSDTKSPFTRLQNLELHGLIRKGLLPRSIYPPTNNSFSRLLTQRVLKTVSHLQKYIPAVTFAPCNGALVRSV